MLEINPEDKGFWKNTYAVILNRHADRMKVYADNAQDAMDAAIDYAEAQGWEGYFLTLEEAQEIEADGFLEDYTCGGNHGRFLSSLNVYLREWTNE